MPPVRQRSRQQSPGHEPSPRAAALSGFPSRAVRIPGPASYVGYFNLKAVQKPNHSRLRMHIVENPDRILVQRRVQSGQNNPAVRQIRDHRQKVGGRRHRTRRTRGNNRLIGRTLPPPIGLGFKQPVAALGRIDGVFPGENFGPLIGDDLQEFQRLLPMRRELFRHQIGKTVIRKPFGLNLIDQPRQLPGQTRGLVRRDLSPFEPLDEAGEDQKAADPRDRGRNCRGAGARDFFPAGDRQRIFVEIAKRQQPGKEQRRPAGLAQERVAQAADGAPCRQEYLISGQHPGIAAGLLQNAGGERVDERHPRRDGINRRGPRALRHRCRMPGKRSDI